jgi:spore coat polysaccharide biosynthesis protein SpsF
MSNRTAQEGFWEGDFGTNYIDRNSDDELAAANLSLFSRALKGAGRIGSCVEFGANIGMNLRALMRLFPHIEVRGVEINPDAAKLLEGAIDKKNVFCGSIVDYQTSEQAELVLSKGVLIHICPEQLHEIYEIYYRTSSRWILLAEYYNPSPVAIPYRGHKDRLYKRDFAGEMLDLYENLRLVDYGFIYRRDPAFPQDDITWFLIGKE